MRTNKSLQTIAVICALTFCFAGVAMAQAIGGGTDVLGITPIRDAIIFFFRIVATAAIGYGFMRLMSGRHGMEAMIVLVVGALGIAKLDAIAAFMGL